MKPSEKNGSPPRWAKALERQTNNTVKGENKVPLLYENTDQMMHVRAHGTKRRKLSPGGSLTTYAAIFVVGAIAGGILVYGPTRQALMSSVAKGARVSAAKVQAWAEE